MSNPLFKFIKGDIADRELVFDLFKNEGFDIVVNFAVESRALYYKPLPVYGEGLNVRDWLYVEDHCRAIDMIIHDGRVGEVYNIGGHNEKQIYIYILERRYSNFSVSLRA